MLLASILVGVALFAALLALLTASYRDIARDVEPAADHEHRSGSDGACVLCRAPLPHFGTADDAVREIEHRIDDDRREIRADFQRAVASIAD